MARCIRIHGKMYQDSWQDVLGLTVRRIRTHGIMYYSMGPCIRCTVLCIRVFGCVEEAHTD